MRLAPALVTALMMLVTCADAPEPAGGGPPNSERATIPDVAQIICEADDTTRVVTPEVLVQPDGLHVRVTVLLDEPAHLDGVRLDPRLPPGARDIVTADPPGATDVACWPVSKLESASFEPTRAGLEILDPEGIYVSEELECLPGDDTAGWSSDFGAQGPDRDPPITPAQAEAVLRRLEPADVVTYAGYPQHTLEKIAVERGGRTIAIMSFFHDGDAIASDDGGICEGEAVIPPGIG